MKATEKKKKGIRANINLRWLLFFAITLFIVFAMVVVWLVQVRMLGLYYRIGKRNDMEDVAETIEQSIGSPELDAIAYQNAVHYGVCVRVMRVEGSVAYEEVSVDVEEDCILHHITDEFISRLYYGAKNSKNGEYSEENTRLALYESGMYYPPYSISADKLYGSELNMKSKNMIYIRLVTGSDNKEYAIILDAKMTPMGVVSDMLAKQSYSIVLMFFFGALLLALILSRLILSPIENMNESAKKLAAGDYDVNFSGGGFRETHELAETLNYTASELSKADRLQKELIANISHDLRTPLTMITGYSEVMRDIPGENTPENVQVIIDEANRLSELVNSLLDLSKLQAGTSTPSIERFDLTEAIKEAMLRYSKLTEHYGYRIELYSDRSVWVEADRGMLLQVLYNLLNNAINYIGEDKLVRVDQSVVSEGRVRISVSDHGVGIAPEQLPYIWDRYYKVDKVHRRATVGTGIGLSIVKGVLDAHGATYGVDSTLGKGSTFWFELAILAEKQDTTHQ